jgi:UPF0716 protein FxsA
MTSRWFVRRVLFIGLPIIEILLIFWVARQIGWLWTILALFAGFVIGLWLLRLAGRNAFALLRERAGGGQRFVTVDEATGQPTTIYQPGAQPGGTAPDPEQIKRDAVVVRESGLLVTAGVLFMIPGFLSDLAGAILALPPIRRALARRRPAEAPAGVVIQGETVVVDDDGAHVTHWGTGTESPGGQPQIISGEVISGEVISGEESPGDASPGESTPKNQE